MKIIYRVFTAVFLMLLVVQCDIATDKSLTSPNSISPENVNPDYLLNSIQFNTRDVYSSASGIGRELTRMGYMFGTTYQNAYNSQSFNSIYQNAYADVFIDVQNLLPIAEEQGLSYHSAMAKTLKAYNMLILVDVFGEMPYEEALDPEIFNPNLTSGQAIYDAAIALLDEAIAEFEAEEWLAEPSDDLFYGGDAEGWIRAANTMKLKAFLNTGNTAGINALVADNMLITNSDDDFKFTYSTNAVNPDSRHPLFSGNYINEASSYMAVNYLNIMLFDKSDPDPRMPYYFYRQQLTGPASPQENNCIGQSAPSWYDGNDPYCTFPTPYDGYWGRDHLNAEGIPPDTDKRTTWGIYPVGGEFDANQNESVDDDMGYAGEGFRPMLMSSFTHFMLAEAAIELSTNTLLADALAHYRAGIVASMETVRDFGADRVDELEASGFAIGDAVATDEAAYIADAEDNWNNQDNLYANSKEFYIALWPNGYEAYNMMRRTGFGNDENPNRNLQPAVATETPGQWLRTFTYPANLVDRNANIDQKPNAHVRTFWDTRGADDEFDY